MTLASFATILLALIVALLPISRPQAHLQGHKLDDPECSAAWAKASPDGNPVSYDRVDPYVIDSTMIDMAEDGSVSIEEFKAACLDGNMKSLEEVAKAMETQKPPPTPSENEYARLVYGWNAAGTEARERFREYIEKSN